MHVLVCKGLSIDHVGVSRDTVFQGVTVGAFSCSCKVIGGDTDCPLQVCQLSRSSESTHFLHLRRDVALFVSTRESRIVLRYGLERPVII